MKPGDLELSHQALTRLREGCDTMSLLLGSLQEEDGDLAPRIHQLRKLGKSLRGGFALFGLEKSSGREIQAVGRLLSGPRDAVSRRQTWDRLRWKDAEDGTAAAIVAMLDQDVATAASRPPEAALAWCLERVARAAADLPEGERLADRDWVGEGLPPLYRRLQRRCERMKRGGEEDFHDARKAIKSWLGAVGFLPAGTVEFPQEIDQLGELLGDENDLATLGFWLAERGFTARFAPTLWKRLEKRRERLRGRALRDASRVIP